MNVPRRPLLSTVGMATVGLMVRVFTGGGVSLPGVEQPTRVLVE